METLKFNAGVLIETKKSGKTGKDYTTLDVILPTGTSVQFMLSQDQISVFDMFQQLINLKK